MKAKAIFRENVLSLLQSRGQRPHDLAQWCRRSDSWLSKILGKDDRNLPIEYLDRIADFFGLRAYQLFQPGLSPLTERRKGDRRSGKDRRTHHVADGPVLMTAADIGLSPQDVAFFLRFKSLTKQDREEIEKLARSAGRVRRRKDVPSTGAAVSGDGSA